MPTDHVELGVSEFVELVNQTFEYAFTGVVILGELANLRVSKGKWLYFDLKDDTATLKFFGTVYQLPGPLEDGMMLKVRGTPKLHTQYGFSVTVQSIQPSGSGSIKQAASLLQAKLQTEGLFEAERKRRLPYPPQSIGLIASKQSAAYADFIKILNARWVGLTISHIDVQVQGEVAAAQIVAAINQLNAQADPPEALVIIRGGGSPEDLATFSTELVTRAVAASRVPTVVAIGHEIDISLAELAADMRASTPSNAAELLVPDKLNQVHYIKSQSELLEPALNRHIDHAQAVRDQMLEQLSMLTASVVDQETDTLQSSQGLLAAYDPAGVLSRGYAVVRTARQLLVTKGRELALPSDITIELQDSILIAQASAIRTKAAKE